MLIVFTSRAARTAAKGDNLNRVASCQKSE